MKHKYFFYFGFFVRIGYNKFVKTKEYNKIYEYIKRQILESRYAVGQKLSPERVLCEEFGVSRITTRHALRLLEEDGLVERFQGRGTFVKGIKPAKLPITDSGFAKSVKEYAPGLYRKLLKNEFIIAPQDISKNLGLDNSKCFLAIRADILDNENIGFDKAYIMPKYCNNVTEELLVKVDFFEKWLENEKIKVAYYRETIEAIEADEETAEILNVKPCSPVLKATEVYYDTNNTVFAVIESHYRGDRVKLTSTISYKEKSNVRVSDI